MLKKSMLLIGLSICTPQSFAQLSLFPSPYIDDPVVCQDHSPGIDQRQSAVIATEMGTHPHRLAHFLWHATRSGWQRLGANERQAIQQLSPAWGQHSPICPMPDVNSRQESLAGEEFLLMHHKMVTHLNLAMRVNGLPCTSGWRAFPSASDPSWPVPRGVPDDQSKSDEMGRLIDTWSQVFSDQRFLQTFTLGQIGYWVEFSIHNQAHMRWALPPGPGDDFSPLSAGSTSFSLLRPTPFDGARFNWLGNPYSSAVNPVFWKLHGWIDDVLIPNWLRANGFLTISERCRSGDRTCYTWKSQWVGDLGRSRAVAGGGGHHHAGAHGASAGGSGPIGSGGPTGVQNGDADRAIQQLLPGTSFQTPGLNAAMGGRGREPVEGGSGPGAPSGGSGHHGALAPAGQNPEWNDPRAFVLRFNSCQ